jgi:CRP-like cAMP-binding protein
MAEGDAAALRAAMVERRATPSESLFREKDPGEGLYVILEGSVSIHRANAKGGDREVATLEAGEVFGEMDLISDRPHTSGARAKTECRLLFLPRERFRALLDGGHRGAAALVLYFARMLAGRLDAMNRRMLDVLDGGKGPARASEFSEFKRRLLKEWVF